MAKKKRSIGWKIRLRNKLRRDRAEEKIRAKDLAKRQEIQSKFLGDTDIDAVKEQSAKIAGAETQLQNDGYDVSGDPIETMATYNEVYGDGNPDDIQQSLQDCFDESIEGESFEGESFSDSYRNVIESTGEILDRFRDNFEDNYEGDVNSLDENFGEKIKGWFKKVGDKFKTSLDKTKKSLAEGKERRKENRAERESKKLRRVATEIENVSSASPDKIESVTKKASVELRKVANEVEKISPTEFTESKESGSPVMMLLLGGLVGVVISKMIK